jgi:hypothetical protein
MHSKKPVTTPEDKPRMPTGKNPPNIQHTVEFSKDNHTTVQADPQGQTFRKATFLA